MLASPSTLTAQLRAERLAVDTLYRAFSEQNPDLVDAVLAPAWEDIPLAPGQAPGPAGIKFIIRTIAAALPDVHIVIHDMVQAPGKIGVRAEICGTHLGELFGIAPTGKQVSFRLHEFHTLENGLVTTTWHLEDWFGLFLQLGQFPPQG
jgi:predicted ester cyclase